MSLDIICSSKLTVRSRKTALFSKQITSANKYPSIFSRQMEAIVYVSRKVISVSKISALNFMVVLNRLVLEKPQDNEIPRP